MAYYMHSAAMVLAGIEFESTVFTPFEFNGTPMFNRFLGFLLILTVVGCFTIPTLSRRLLLLLVAPPVLILGQTVKWLSLPSLSNFYFSSSLGRFCLNYLPYAVFMIVMSMFVAALSYNWKNLLLVERSTEATDRVDKL